MTKNHFKNPAYFRSAVSGDAYHSYDGKPWQPEDVKLTNVEGMAAIKKQSCDYLRKVLKPGMTVYCVLRHRSASGMSRCISLVIGGKNSKHGEIESLDWHVARAMGDKIDNTHGGIKVVGCGMDMGFHLVYNLGRTLWPNGTKKPHGSRNCAPDSDGGYALKSSWV